MDKKLKAATELSICPMLAVEDYKIIHANSRAEELLGPGLSGRTAVGIVPGYILENKSESFVASASFDGQSFCVSAARVDSVLLLSLSPDGGTKAGSSDFLSDGLLNSMLSSLFTIGLAIDRINSFAEIDGNERLEGYFAILNHNYFSLRRSLQNLRTAIDIKRSELHYSIATLDLANLCSELVSTLTALCKGKETEISFSTPHGSLYAEADREKLERILLNLISNSLTHTPKGGKISISLERNGSSACITVRDNGSGIPAAAMANLFTRFEQQETELTAVSGGLGLGVARGLAEGMGGALIIESREGHGTSVCLTLPLSSGSSIRLESPSPFPEEPGMWLVLTELSGVLDRELYSKKYCD